MLTSLQKLERYLADLERASNGGAVLSDAHTRRGDHLPVADALQAVREVAALVAAIIEHMSDDRTEWAYNSPQPNLLTTLIPFTSQEGGQ